MPIEHVSRDLYGENQVRHVQRPAGVVLGMSRRPGHRGQRRDHPREASPHRQSLVTDAVEMADASRLHHDDGLIAHSDNGSQYTSYEYTERLKRAGIAPSRGSTGTALDNAVAESIMSTLKRELIKRYTWRTRLDLELALVTYIG